MQNLLITAISFFSSKMKNTLITIKKGVVSTTSMPWAMPVTVNFKEEFGKYAQVQTSGV
jgi:hypothetical protein